MQKQSKGNLLVQSVLASTLFVVPLAAQAFTIDTVNPPPGPPYQTSKDGSVEITPTGQISIIGGVVAINGIELNSPNGDVKIDAANKNGTHAIESITNPGGHGIAVIAAGTSGTIFIGQQSGVFVSSFVDKIQNAINVDNTDTIIINEGTLATTSVGIGGAILVTNNGSNTRIENNLGGVIKSDATGGVLPPNATIQTNPGSTGFILVNNGIVTEATTQVDTIQLNGVYTEIVNLGNGVISQTDPLGILPSPGSAIHVTGTANGSGTIRNLPGGVITSQARPDTVFIDNTNATGTMQIGAIVNQGTISNTDPIAGGAAIGVNAGGAAQDIKIAQIVNLGTLSSIAPAFATVSTFGGVFNGQIVIITDGFINEGDIIGGIASDPGSVNAGLNVAIDFSQQATHATLVQVGGKISGDVFLARESPNGGDPTLVFEMVGGIIAGNVYGTSTRPNLYEVLGGNITGSLIMGAAGDTLDLSGTGFIHTILGNALNTDTINITGGSFNFLNTSGVLVSTTNVNILDSFTQDGTINGNGSLLNINVLKAGTVYTQNGPIFGLNGILTVGEGTTFIPNSYIEFTGDGSPSQLGLKNNGTVLITDSPVFDMLNGARFVTDPAQVILAAGGVLTINGNATPEVFDLTSGSSLVDQINGVCPPGLFSEFGLLVVNSTLSGTVVDLEAGSFIVPEISGVIADGAKVPLIIVNDGAAIPPTGHFINNDATIIQPASPTITFTSEAVVTAGLGETLSLVAHRNPFDGFVDGVAVGVAGALDAIVAQGVCNSDLCSLIGILDLSTTGDIDATLDSLTPQHNYGLIAASHIGVDSMFEGITDRVWDVAWHRTSPRPSGDPLLRGRRNPKGINAGDGFYNNAGIWLRPIIAYVDQSSDDGVAGYRAKAWGGAIGADVGLNDCSTVGLAVSYTHVNVDDKAFAPKDEEVEAWMGTLYGSLDFTHGVYLDAMVAGAHNEYEMNRVIVASTFVTAAQSSFDGTTWAAQADLGMALPYVDFFLAPFARLKWVHVNFDDFTEAGADGLDLTVSTDDANEFLGGIGIRMAGDLEYCRVEWVPELMAMIGYDFTLDGEDTLANFVGCGPEFATEGVTPGKTVFDLGLALNAMIGPASVVTAKYNLELREDFVSNTAYIQYFYNWS